MLGKDVPVSFAHGAYFADSKIDARQKICARMKFQENTSIFLKSSKIDIRRKGHILFEKT